MSERDHPDFVRKRSELIQIIVAAVLLAFIVSLLGNAVYDFLGTIVDVHYVSSYVLAVVPFVMVLFVGIAVLANMYLGTVVAREVPMVLLINRVTGEVMPSIAYGPGSVANMIVSQIAKNKKASIFEEELPGIDNKILHDLSEVIVVDWFAKFQSYAIPIPGIGRKYIVLKPSDLIKMFGENMFLGIVSSPQGPTPDITISIPNGFDIYAKRRRPKAVVIAGGPAKAMFFRKAIGGELGGCELGVIGKFFNPLKYFIIKVFVESVSCGDVMVLEMLGRKPIVATNELILLDDGSIIDGEDLEKLRNWIKVNYQVIIMYKFRGWLFFHPRFIEVVRWAQTMSKYAEEYFDISRRWEEIRLHQQEYMKLLKFIKKLFKIDVD